MATINRVIDIVDGQKPNAYSEGMKKHWLDQMDRMAKREVFDTHEGGPETFDGYNNDTDGETELLIPDDFTQVYVYWLCAMMDFANQETSRYTNDMIMFNSYYADFANWYNRNHMPIGTHMKGAEARTRRR